MKLWPFQERAVADTIAAIAKGPTLLVAPTGSGKTVMAAEIAKRYKSVLIVAHRRELVDQARKTMARHVASMSIQRALSKGPADVDLLIIDEAHRAEASTYRQLIAKYPLAARLGLTATPLRTDGRGLLDAFSEMVCASGVKELVADGHLVPYTAFEAPDEALQHLKNLRKRGGDYATKELTALVNTPRIIGKVVDEYIKHALGIPAVAFAVSIKHSLALVAAFRKSGIRAVHVDGNTASGARADVSRLIAEDKVDVICNVNLFTEGWDCPEITCVIMARPTASLTLYLQCVGRGMRPHVPSGKSGLLILDHAGNIARHGYPDDDREWSLNGRLELERRETKAAELKRLAELGFDSLEQYQLAQQTHRQNTYSAKECDQMFGGLKRRTYLFEKHGIKKIGLGKGKASRFSKAVVEELYRAINQATYSNDEIADLGFCKKNTMSTALRRQGIRRVENGRYLKQDIDRLIDRLSLGYDLEECRLILSPNATLRKVRAILNRNGVVNHGVLHMPRYDKKSVDALAAKHQDHRRTTYTLKQCVDLLAMRRSSSAQSFLRRRGILPVSRGRYSKASVDQVIQVSA